VGRRKKKKDEGRRRRDKASGQDKCESSVALATFDFDITN
jgi:hypothetical protein